MLRDAHHRARGWPVLCYALRGEEQLMTKLSYRRFVRDHSRWHCVKVATGQKRELWNGKEMISIMLICASPLGRQGDCMVMAAALCKPGHTSDTQCAFTLWANLQRRRCWMVLCNGTPPKGFALMCRLVLHINHLSPGHKCVNCATGKHTHLQNVLSYMCVYIFLRFLYDFFYQHLLSKFIILRQHGLYFHCKIENSCIKVIRFTKI